MKKQQMIDDIAALVANSEVSDAAAEKLWGRISQEDHRPLARDREAYAKLLETRRESYAQADFRIDAHGSPQEVLDRILALELL